MKYGLNYQGSKNPIVEEMCDLFPKKTNFYDLFMGGGAVTHRMLQLGTFERYFASDINKMPVNLFANCFYGDIPEPKWVERDDFEALKSSNPYVACCYSFGGDWSSYLYSKEKEPIQRALHLAVVDDDGLVPFFGKGELAGEDLAVGVVGKVERESFIKEFFILLELLHICPNFAQLVRAENG